MAKDYVSIYINEAVEENLVRKFSGSRFDVRLIVNKYKNMDKEKFLKKHPQFEDKCKNEFKLLIFTSCSVY